MTRAGKLETSRDRAAAGSAGGAELTMFDRGIFFALAGLLCARLMLSETPTFETLGFLANMLGGGGSTPVTSAWMDFVTLVLSSAAIIRSVRRNSWVVFCAVVVLQIAVFVSWLAAGDQMSARLLGFQLVIGVLACIGLTLSARARWMKLALIAALFATGTTTAVKCIVQRTYEFRETYNMWLENKPAEVKAGRIDPDSPLVINFERRMLSMDAFGFTSHPNVTATLLVIWAAGAIGVFGGAAIHWRSSGGRLAAVAALLAALFAAALWTTGSAGGAVGLAAAIATIGLLWWQRARIAAHPAIAVAAFGIAYAGVIAVGAWYGAMNDRLPHVSLEFRWHYYKAAWQAWTELPLPLAIGRGNFGDAFLLRKSVLSPEEVKDIHAVWLSLLAELGPLALIAVVALVGWMMTRMIRAAAGGDFARAATSTISVTRETLVRTAWPLAVTTIAFHVLFWDNAELFTGGFGSWIEHVTSRWVPVCGTQVAALWIAAYILFLIAVHALDGHPRARGGLAIGLVAGFIGALVHNLIDFALIIAAGLSIVALLTAAVFPAESMSSAAVVSARSSRARWIVAGLLALLTILVFALSTSPTTAVGRGLARLDAVTQPDARRPFDEVRDVARATANLCTIDAIGPARGAQLLAGLSRVPSVSADERIALLKEALELAKLSRNRNPKSVQGYRHVAALCGALAEMFAQRGDAAAAGAARDAGIQSWTDAVAHYPSDPATRLKLADAAAARWRVLHDAESAAIAEKQVNRALALDDQRPPEEIMRLSKGDRAKAAALLAEITATTQP